MTQDPIEQSPSDSSRHLVKNTVPRLSTLQKRIEKSIEGCWTFDGFVTQDLLHQDRKCMRPELVKKLRSYERSLEELISVAQANLNSLWQIRRKFNRRDFDGGYWHEPPPANLWKHLRSLGLNV